MSKHLFRLVFGAFFLVAATAFTGCSDDDDKSLTPKLTADPTALDFTDETPFKANEKYCILISKIFYQQI